jgi:hypothetical protein
LLSSLVDDLQECVQLALGFLGLPQGLVVLEFPEKPVFFLPILVHEILSKLESSVLVDGSQDCFHVWVHDLFVLLHKLIDLDWVLPAVDLAVEAKVQNGQSGSSSHAGLAVDIDLSCFSLDQSIKEVSRIEELIAKGGELVEFRNWHVLNTVDAVLVVELLDVMMLVSLTLEIQYSGDTGFSKFLDVSLVVWLVTDDQIRSGEFCVIETLFEIGIEFVDHAIDDPNFFAVEPLILASHLAWIGIWIRDGHFPGRFGLPLNSSVDSCSGVIVSELLQITFA